MAPVPMAATPARSRCGRVAVKLIIQIPCLNERETLPETIAALPRHIPGIDEIEVLIIDDGSTDGTAERAAELRRPPRAAFPAESRLGAAFTAGIDAGIELGADIIVNTDATISTRVRTSPCWSRPSSPAGPSWSSATARPTRSRTFPRSRSCCSAGAPASCVSYRPPTFRTRRAASRNQPQGRARPVRAQSLHLHVGDRDPGGPRRAGGREREVRTTRRASRAVQEHA